VLPSTGEFDSRTYRIATAAIARGHSVTVLARWKAGLPEREMDPAGYEIIRIRADPGEALPGRDVARRFVRIADRESSDDGLADDAGDDDETSSAEAADVTVPSVAEAGAERPEPAAAPPAAPGGVLLRPIRRLAGRMIRQWSILLTIRALSRRAREVARLADLFHGLG
jgi:hypothetical protein